MDSRQAAVLLRHVRQQVAGPAGDADTDRALLKQFAVAGDEAAFATLVRRHGSLVLRVCRHVLGNTHDAEDAFQATFLVLARKAGTTAWQDSLAGWLHEVASRVALKARTAGCRRRAHESLAAAPSGVRVAGDGPGAIDLGEAQALLNEELNRLPEKLRTPLVLCYLEGKTQSQAARQAGWSFSTLKRRLRQGLKLLQRRLERRGLTPAAIVSVTVVNDGPPTSPALLEATTRAGLLFRAGLAAGGPSRAAALAEGLLKSMFWARARFIGALVLAAALAVGGGLVALQVVTDRSKSPAQTSKAPRPDGKRPAERAGTAEPKKLATLQGNVGALRAMALSPDGRTLASAGSSVVELWDVDASAPRAALRQATDPQRPSLVQPVPTHQGTVCALAFSPDGKTLATGAGGVYSPTPRRPGKVGNVEGEVRLWDVATGKEKALVRRYPVTVYSLAFSPDGRTLAWGGGVEQAAADTTYRESFTDIPGEYLQFKEFGELRVCDPATGKERTFFRGAAGRIKSVSFSPDGKTLASGGRDGAIRLFDVATGKERGCLREMSWGIDALAFSPDGKTLASVHEYRLGRIEKRGESVKLWDLATGRVRARLEAPAVWTHAVAFCADSQTVTTAGEVFPHGRARGEVRLWDAATGKPRGTPLRVDHNAYAVAIGARGKKKILASAGECHLTKDMLSPEEQKILTLPGYQNYKYLTKGRITLWELDPPGGADP
jgi:RNA polymerase sigma factor (sigma-70 family)